MKRMAKMTSAIGLLGVLIVGGYLMTTWASPASGLTRVPIGRGSFKSFMVNTDQNQTLNPPPNPDGSVPKPFQYIAKGQAFDKTEPALDMEVDAHYYNPLASTGWHKHPGPVYIIVTSGQLTFYEYDDPTCSPKVYSKGQGFVDYGAGHIGFNKDPNNPASDVTLAITSVGGAFRTELDAPGPYCNF
ncbi:MAG TPA: hypothetical protein VLC12_05115 [Terriglobales bacterium]|nr:hypothetical protein [Terriglobales bacterium]